MKGVTKIFALLNILRKSYKRLTTHSYNLTTSLNFTKNFQIPYYCHVSETPRRIVIKKHNNRMSHLQRCFEHYCEMHAPCFKTSFSSQSSIDFLGYCLFTYEKLYNI